MQRPWKVGFVAVLLLASFIRAVPLDTGLPYTIYLDEPYVLRGAAHQIDERTLDPEFYDYPSLLVETTALTALGLAAITGRSAELREGAERTDDPSFFDQIEPAQLIVAGRLLVLASGIATVAVTMLLARRLAGRRAALLAGLVLAVLPAAVTRSAIVITDTPVTLFVMLTLLVASSIPTSRRPVHLAALAGATSGLAAGTKYPSGMVLLAVLAMVAMTGHLSVRRRCLAGAAAVAAAIPAVLLSMPALLLSPTEVHAALRHLADGYAGKSSTSYLSVITTPEEVGWALLVPAAIGLVLLALAHRTRRLTVAWLAFATPFCLVAVSQPFQPFRNLLPLFPFLCVAAAVTCVAVGDEVVRRLPRLDVGGRRLVGTAVPGALALGIAAALYVGGVESRLDYATSVVSSRAEVRHWLADRVGPDDRVIIAEELRFLPGELEQIPGEVTVARAVPVGDETSPYRYEDYDFVVTGPIDAPTFDWARQRYLAQELRAFGWAPPLTPEPDAYHPATEAIWVYRP